MTPGMAAPETLIAAALIVPLIAAALIPAFFRAPNLRETVTLVAAGLVALIVWNLAPHIVAGGRPELHLASVAPGLEIAFRVEPLGMLFALVAGSLWIVNSVYSIGYMRGHDEPRQTSFFVCFAVAIASAMGIAFAGNLFTLFIFYEVLTLSTYPLVTHKATPEAMRGGRVYLMLLIGTSMVLFLPAIIITGFLAGTLDFTAGGILADKVGPTGLAALLALFMFGIGKAALMPFHRWLPSAMVAPTPVSALLHAVAVVKAGVFCVLKIVVYVFGVEALASTGANEWLIVVASITLLLASMIAMTKDNLKARLAYSTVSQLSYVVLGASLAVSAGIIGGSVQIAMHAVGKITLFFCAGAIYVAAHKTEISELGGLGRKMPWTFGAFLVGALSIIGLPPLGGSWAKWWLLTGAFDSGQTVVVFVLILSSLLNVLYLLPIVFTAFFSPALKPASVGAAAAGELPDGLERKHWLVVLPPCVTAAACIVLFFYVDQVVGLIEPIVSP
ncbi:MAG: monovalent cation/H+ antiporter subunit D family protein [Rhizobiaceae bacterium]